MSLSYIDWEVDGVTVLNLSGQLTLGDGTRVFRQLIDDAVSLDKKMIIVNLAEVFRIDSTGLGELVSAHSTLTRSGGNMKLIKVPPRAQALVQLTRLHTILELFDDEDSAVRSFKGEAIRRK